MNFPCPKCNTPDKGVLLFNLVAPCDACVGILPEKKKEKYTIEIQRDLPGLGQFIRVALVCGENTTVDREYVEAKIELGTHLSYTWTKYKDYSTHWWFTDYLDSICIVQWSE